MGQPQNVRDSHRTGDSLRTGDSHRTEDSIDYSAQIITFGALTRRSRNTTPFASSTRGMALNEIGDIRPIWAS